ncbi:MAG: DNA primase [Pseudomonadales bacterium]|nr:DNA primase [Pseudomonadales bacterium]MBO6565517.1 DNA primase [Pseudomonadales bacterium]MBO6594198.1 DNA primase [Pseudomonadales bacterium]MBO6822241.1 DNA primase [Pseudomonadales bacterium]
MIPQEFIDEVLSRTDIVEIIEPRVALKKSGQNYSGLCPFHNEKSPSFSVSQDKQFYYCFGCQASGSALKFLMEHDRMDFRSAVEFLAQRVGMEVPDDRQVDRGASERRKSIYDVLEKSTEFFKEQLKSHEKRDRAVGYLKGRGLTGEIARDFGLGYAPPGWDNLMKKLATTNADRQLLIDSGMLTDNRDEDKTYDRFRDRIMFPIRDLRGRTIAFGGRVLDADAKPKYLNSPETPVFHKGRELYGLYEARKRVRRLERLVVVEGYMDVVALAQHGVGYSVATLGTATSTEHLARLFRIVPQVIFCFDGDAAGSNAAWKALLNTLPAMEDGCTAKFMFVPEGDDPDSLIRKEGQEKFEARLQKASGLTEFFFNHLSEGLNLDAAEDRAALSKKAVPLIETIPEGVFKELLINELSQKTGLDMERLVGATGLDRDVPPPDAPPEDYGSEMSEPESPQRSLKLSRIGEHATAILLRQPDVANLLDESDLAKLDGVPEWQMLVELVTWVHQAQDASPMLLLSHYHDTPYFGDLRRLAEQDPMLSKDQLAGEFLDTLRKMLHDSDLQQKQKVIEMLTRKPLSELSPEERQMLANYRREQAQN